ncbi:hypothetical protein AYK24_02460 [Thermoplasmatales archaeon SG8-52-4]|nr:MAG: hypothetical protein AYK24_02460 [Thermoplasmatales archaeon SG8-52-4]
MIPGVEAKIAVPFAIITFGWEWWQVFPIAILGNMILVPVGLKFFKYEEQFLRKYELSRRFIDNVLSRIRRRTDKKVQKYKSLGLLFFVALPLPFTGAGLGVVIAYLFDFKFYNSIIIIFIGVIISTTLTTIFYFMGLYIF